MKRLSPWAEKDTMDRFTKEAIRTKRVAAGLTQAEAAENAGMSDVKTWGALERPKGRAAAVGLLQIHAIAQAVGTTGADLFRTANELRAAAGSESATIAPWKP